MNKTERVLGIYTKLLRGEIVNKSLEAVKYGVDERSIQRDIDSIRNYLESEAGISGFTNSIVYSKSQKGYCMKYSTHTMLSNAEIFAICKILLESRAFLQKEMCEIIEKLISLSDSKETQKLITDLTSNEIFHYVEPRHKKALLSVIWELGQAVVNKRCLEINYTRTKDNQTVTRKVKPIAIMFSEYYFYLIAFIDDENVKKDFDLTDDPFPTIYRVDRIKRFKILAETFYIPYSQRFEEGEYRKRIQYMYGGEKKRIKFKVYGKNIEAVLDRIPTAKILNEDEEGFILTAEVFGKGIEMWLRSQGNNVKILEGK